jgi:uncharacterized protein DUF1653
MTIQLGIYRHYKGPLYQVLGLAHDANADELLERDPHTHDFCLQDGKALVATKPLGARTVVVYIPLQLDGGAHLGPRMAVRTLEDFEAWVHRNENGCERPEGTACTDGACEWYDLRTVQPRFRYLGPELTKEML